jgi:hypothetical protein
VGTPAAPERQSDGFLARSSGGLLAAVWVLPLLAAVFTVVFYLTGLALPTWFPGRDQTPAVLGPLLGVPAWVILGLVTSNFATARNANHTSYGELTARLSALEVYLGGRPAAGSAGPVVNDGPYEEARKHWEEVQRELDGDGVRWVTRLGYITAWQQLHRAEEAILMVESPAELLAEAVYDELRLTGSTMEHADTIRNMVVSSEAFLRQQLGGPEAPASATMMAPIATEPLPTPALRLTVEPEARGAIQAARYALNQFIDETFAGIVRARNQLLRALIVAEVAGYLVLELAVLADRPENRAVLHAGVMAAVAFFLIGALVGVFNRVSVQARTDTAINDYGLSTMRLIVTPIVSGIAAVVGVVLVGVLYSAGLTSLVPSASGASPISTSLTQIFDLHRPVGLVVAAVFGLTPTLVFDRLNTLAEGYKKDIKSTQAANTTPK